MSPLFQAPYVGRGPRLREPQPATELYSVHPAENRIVWSSELRSSNSVVVASLSRSTSLTSPPNKSPHTSILCALALLPLLLFLRLERMVFLPLLILSVRLNRSVEVPLRLLEVQESDVISEMVGYACQYISTDSSNKQSLVHPREARVWIICGK